MPPDPQTHDVSRDPITDGRDSLRLVRLRLALTLVAVAILPMAAMSPLVRAVAEEARVTHHQRLADQATSTAAEVRHEVTLIQAAAHNLLSDPAIVAAAGAHADGAARRRAGDRLAQLTERPGGVIVGATLVTGDGARASVGAPIDLEVLPPGVLVTGLAVAPSASGTQLLVVETSRAANKPARAVVSAISVPALLELATPQVGIPGRVLHLVDASGTVIAETAGSFDPSALPGEMLDVATLATGDSDGRSAVHIPGVGGWHVVVSAPIPFVAMPAQAIAALAGVVVLLVVFTVWMARQILRPAGQLEASRSRLRELYEAEREAALRDSLTGLGNHRSFQESVARMVEGARRYGTDFSLVLIDIDEFKRINDSKGHAVGDQLLAEVGALITSSIRLSDSAFRVGGDEFAILLPHTDVSGAIVVARRLLGRALQERAHGDYRAPISFSAGVTACPEFGMTRLELTAQADAAMYRGKRAGRTVVTIYDPAKDHGHVDEGMRAELSSAISAVIESGSLTPVYQPIVELASGRVVAYEGLVRVPRQSTFAHTGALFDAAEVAGRVHDLDRAALDVVLSGAHSLHESMYLSVNISPRTLEAPEFSAVAFLAILRRHEIPPERVVLELTERETIRDPERLRSLLAGVQSAGVRLAADDVGAGNAGLRLLSQFRFDVVKIDLSLVQRAGDDRTHSVLRSIVELAQRMGATTIAEGVETSGQLRMARRLGITSGQGYMLGRPGPERDLTWVDIAALEQREDIAVAIRAEPLRPLRPPSDWVQLPDPDAESAAVLAGSRVTSTRRRSMTFFRPSRRASD